MNKFEKFEQKNKIRHIFDERYNENYFSVIDLIENLGISKDPRNYWKVLKNRLKLKQNELVTGCTTTKLLSKDGKSYQTDVATSDILLKIIHVVSPSWVKSYGEYFDYLNERSREEYSSHIKNIDLSTAPLEEGEISIDLYEENGSLFIKAMIAGIEPSRIFISVNYNKIIIRGDRLNNNDIKENDYFMQELFWGKFCRTIDLPHEIDIDQIDATINRGMLTLRCPILDKERVRIIKIKSL